ncbi:MAG TPA: cytochrome c peroxidase [Polyangia bacterium]|nr:cytochrome c peroxidase [Polyangia bacterium]
MNESSRKKSPRGLFALALAGIALGAACSRADGAVGHLAPATAPAATAAAPGPAAPPPRALTPAAEVGKQLFFDKTLSASGQMSCATCHDPAHAYGPPDGLAVQLGGPARTSPGLRAVPSIRYKEFTPGYQDLLDNPDGFSLPAPGGGLAWDGRANSLAEQSKAPLLSPFEMANANPAELVSRLRASPSAPAFTRAFGAAALADDDAAFAKVQQALQAFQIEDPSFHPYNSKYDLWLYKKPGAELTAAEQRGLAVFKDKDGGNCQGCHLADASMDDGAPAQLTDFSFEAIGVPRNPEIPANRDPKYRDLGVCGPLRDDHAKFPEYCGLFKTPTLRNAATRRVFFHNGVVHSLEQAVRFYATRDTRPELWYPTVGGRAKAAPDPGFPRYGLVTTQYAGGTVQKYDDLPAPYRKNLDRQLPLDGRAAGGKDPLIERQIGDLLCFLQTLTDDYLPGTPPASPRCVN